MKVEVTGVNVQGQIVTETYEIGECECELLPLSITVDTEARIGVLKFKYNQTGIDPEVTEASM